MQSSSLTQVIWRFIRPEIEELALYVLILIGFIVSAFIRVNSTAPLGDSYGTTASFQLINSSLKFITDGSDTVAKLFTFGAWFAIGTTLYAIVWFLITFSNGAFKDITVASQYVHPRTFNKSSYWLAIVSRTIVRIAAAITLLLYTVFWSGVLAPAWHSSFVSVFSNGVILSEVSDLSITIIGIGLTLHVGAMLVRMILLRSRYSYQK